jgi:hypothetical protein
MNPRVVLLLTRVVLKGLQRCDGTLSLSDYSAYLSRLVRADERTRTADLLQLRVIIHELQGCAEGCKSTICKRISFLCHALCYTVLRSEWYQSGVSTTVVIHARSTPLSL